MPLTMPIWSALSENWKKTIKISIITFVLLFGYIYLFSIGAKDHEFLITGGTIGFASSLIVLVNCLLRLDSTGNWQPQISLLFWRAICEAGTGFRYVLQPAFNLYICHSLQCTRESGDPDRCAFPSFMLEFFVLASEFWFLCNGLDLYYSITNPFFSYNKRVMYYHGFCWTTALVFASSPFWLIPKWQEIYGFWFINPNIDDSANCWIKITWDNYAWPIWVYFFVPLLMIYFVCLFSLIVAYLRLRRGVTRSFLPRMRLLIMNTVNLVVHMLYWAVFVLFYSWTFWTRSQFKANENQPTNNIIYFVMGSKGCSALLVWILTANNSQLGLTAQNKKTDGDENLTETIDANKALRQEVLSFATAGIRSSARAGAKLTPDRKVITRRPQQHQTSDSDEFENLISPMFFLRFILGYVDELTTLEELVGNKQRSVNETFMRQTVTITPSTMTSVHLRNRTASSASSVVGTDAMRLSQRPTVVSGTEHTRQSAQPSFLAGGLSFFGGGAANLDRHLSSLDQRIGAQHGDAEAGMEMDSFGKVEGRRSSSMVEKDTDVMEGAELFDLASTKARFWRNVYDFFLDPSESVEFTEFEPYHFRRVRLAGGITDSIYSMYFSTTIKERLTQGGASGAFFFFSKGEKFIAKSCSGEELDTLKHNAEAYANYMEANPDSCISRIYGAYKLQIYGNALHFFVMNNIFLNAERLAMNEKYDIKGSWVARNAAPPVNGMTVTCTYCEQKYTYSTKKKKTSRRARMQRDLRPVSMDKSKQDTATSDMLANLADLGMLNTTTSPMANNNTEGGGSAAYNHALHSQQSSSQLFGARNLTRSGETQDTEESADERGGCPYTVSGEHEPSVILKDNDIKYKIRLPRNTTEGLLAQIRADAEFLYSIGVMDYSLLVGVHNTEYEVMAEDPGSTIHTLVKTHSSSFGSSNSPSSGTHSPKTLGGGSSVRPSDISVGAADTKRPFANSSNDAARGSVASTMSGSTTSQLTADDADAPPAPSAGANSPARSASGLPSANATAAAYMMAAARSGLTGEVPSDVVTGKVQARADTPESHGAGYATRNSTGVARLSRLSLGYDGHSINSDSVAHSQDTENTGDLGFARKLEVYRVVGPDAYFMGIIDFQQKWTITKRLERFFKLNLYGHDPDGLSAIEPLQYRDRFLRKMEDILDSDYAYQNRFVPAEPADSR